MRQANISDRYKKNYKKSPRMPGASSIILGRKMDWENRYVVTKIALFIRISVLALPVLHKNLYAT